MEEEDTSRNEKEEGGNKINNLILIVDQLI